VQIAAILRGATVAALAAEWRPEVIASVEPVSAARSAFQLDRRRSLIDLMREARI
jgi:hypothetical protein